MRYPPRPGEKPLDQTGYCTHVYKMLWCEKKRDAFPFPSFLAPIRGMGGIHDQSTLLLPTRTNVIYIILKLKLFSIRLLLGFKRDKKSIFYDVLNIRKKALNCTLPVPIFTHLSTFLPLSILTRAYVS